MRVGEFVLSLAELSLHIQGFGNRLAQSAVIDQGTNDDWKDDDGDDDAGAEKHRNELLLTLRICVASKLSGKL